MKIKFLIFFLMIVLISNVSKAQRPPVGSYVTSTDIDKFIGVRKWSNENEFELFGVAKKFIQEKIIRLIC